MIRILSVLAILALLLPAAPRAEAEVDVSIDFFYNNLGDGGNWIDVEDYGYCWQPNVAVSNSNWRPYSDGYWAYTDVGWTWVSYEDFGWATYHYGRWARLREQGWVWVPGREWGPAWVSWRTGGDYVGWAPLPPRYAGGGREVVYDGRPINGRVDIDFDIGPSYYNFVDVRYIGEPVLRERIFDPGQNINYINRTVNVTNITYTNERVYNYGPDYNTLSAYSTRPIRRMNLERQANVDFRAAAPSGGFTRVQGDRLLVAAPLKVQQGERTLAPKAVKTKIAKANLETGWMGISDPKAKAELQQKFKTEDLKSIPPPQLPKTNPAAVTNAPGGSPAASGPNPTAGISPASGSTPPVTEVSPSGTVTPAPQGTATPKDGRNTRGQPPVSSPSASTVPAATASPALAPNEARGKGRESREKTGQPPQPTATPATGAQPPEATAVPATPDEQTKGKEKNRRGPNQPLSRPSAAPETGIVPQETALPSAPPVEPRGEGKRAVQPLPTFAPTAPPSAGAGNAEPGAVNPKPERKVVAPNPPDRSGLRTTNRPEGAATPDVKPNVPQDPPQSVERQMRKGPVPPQQQIAPQPGGPANVPANVVRPDQPKGEKGKKEKKGEEAPSPAPEP